MVLNCVGGLCVEKKLLWCCGYEKYDEYKEPITQTFAKKDEQIVIFDKFHKAGVLNELKVTKYDYLVIYEHIDQTMVSVDDIEFITDNYPDLRVVFIIDNSHKGDIFIQKLINISFFNAIYEQDINDSLIVELLSLPRKRKAAKFYYQYEKEVEQFHVSDEQITNILYHLENEETIEDKLVLFERVSSKFTADDIFHMLKQFPDSLLKDLSANNFVSNFIKSKSSQDISKNRLPKKILENIGLGKEVPNPNNSVPEDGYSVKVVREKVVTVLDSERKNVVSFKRLILTFAGSSECASDIGYAISKLSVDNLTVTLINLDFRSPKVLMYFCIEEEAESRKYSSNFGIDCVVKNINEGLIDKKTFEEACLRVKGHERLQILTDYIDLENQKGYTGEEIKSIIQTAYKYSDVVIITTGEDITATNNIMAFDLSDYNIIAVPATYDNISQHELNMLYLAEAQKIPIDKVKFIATEYQECLHLTISKLKTYFNGNSSYIGILPYDEKRVKYRNLNSFYGKWSIRKYKKYYTHILSVFSISTKLYLKDRSSIFYTDIARSLHKIIQKIKLMTKKGGD